MFIKPMLASLKTAEDATQEGYLFEKKYDGERAIIEMTGQTRLIYARSGREKSRMYPDLMIETRLPCVLDGEIAAATGKFNDIQHRANRENGIKEAAKRYPVIFYPFDILFVDGVSVMHMPLSKRKEYLNKIMIATPNCIIAPTYTDEDLLWKLAQSQGWEGIIGKRMNSVYSPAARGSDWFKRKDKKRGEFWVIGYTAGIGWRESTFGAMILAKFENELFVPVGEVGTGFDQRELEMLNDKLKSHVRAFPWFNYPEPATWVQPFKVVVEYLELTNDGKIRFPAYKGVVPGY